MMPTAAGRWRCSRSATNVRAWPVLAGPPPRGGAGETWNASESPSENSSTASVALPRRRRREIDRVPPNNPGRAHH